MITTLLTINEVCALLKIPKSWVYQNVHAGTLPFRFLKIGHFLRFPEADVISYVEAQLAAGQQAADSKRKLRAV